MLTSIVLHLQALENGRIHGSTGRAVQGFWYNQWRRTNPNIADRLHQGNQIKPFTVSPLLGLSRPQRGVLTVHPGDTAVIRLTTLEPTLSYTFLEHWLPALPGQMEISNLSWAIAKIALTHSEHPQASSQSYADLVRQGQNKEPTASTWTFRFTTPTTFHVSKNAFLPFPLPAMLIKSWLRRWNAFAPQPLPQPDELTLREGLVISAYQLKTVPVRYGRSLTIGCVGKITLIGKKLPSHIRATITTLAHYANYCGTGNHTTRGMGQTIYD